MDTNKEICSREAQAGCSDSVFADCGRARAQIWTFGYGISSETEFLNRLSAAFPDPTDLPVIVDIRKENSGSRNPGNWANWGERMRETCCKVAIDYRAIPELANPHGNTMRGLAIYENELLNGHRRTSLDELVKMIITHPHEKFCLMCSERKPFKGRCHADPQNPHTTIGHWDGATNCHRARVATNITARAWYGHKKKYEVIHIYGGKQ